MPKILPQNRSQSLASRLPEQCVEPAEDDFDKMISEKIDKFKKKFQNSLTEIAQLEQELLAFEQSWIEEYSGDDTKDSAVLIDIVAHLFFESTRGNRPISRIQ
jgi:hypothetical protein